MRVVLHIDTVRLHKLLFITSKGILKLKGYTRLYNRTLVVYMYWFIVQTFRFGQEIFGKSLIT